MASESLRRYLFSLDPVVLAMGQSIVWMRPITLLAKMLIEQAFADPATNSITSIPIAPAEPVRLLPDRSG